MYLHFNTDYSNDIFCWHLKTGMHEFDSASGQSLRLAQCHLPGKDIEMWMHETNEHSLHALRCLPGNVDDLQHLKLGLEYVQVLVEA